MHISKLIALAAIVSLPAVAATAAPVFEVTDNPGGQNLPAETVADGGTYSTPLTIFDSLSINVDSQGQDTFGSLDFTFNPTPLTANISVILSTFDFADFGETTVTLSDGVDNFSDTITAAGQEINFSGRVGSPLTVAFNWTNLTSGSFNADLTMSAIPVPAGVFLLLGALGGLGLIRRKAAV